MPERPGPKFEAMQLSPEQVKEIQREAREKAPEAPAPVPSSPARELPPEEVAGIQEAVEKAKAAAAREEFQAAPTQVIQRPKKKQGFLGWLLGKK